MYICAFEISRINLKLYKTKFVEIRTLKQNSLKIRAWKQKVRYNNDFVIGMSEEKTMVTNKKVICVFLYACVL